GTVLTYTITIKNNGPSDVTTTVVSDTVPPGTTLSALSVTSSGGATWSCVLSAGVAQCSITSGSLTAGNSAVFNLGVKVDPGASQGSTITNTAQVLWNVTGNTGSHTGSTSNTVGVPSASLAVVKSISTD